ncbi:MAG: lysophospholipid acyltransferase family protein [Candidatus Binatia bacterium]
MIVFLVDMLARLPMPWFHRAGKLFGWLTYVFSPPDRKRLKQSLRAAGVFSSEGEYNQLLEEAIGQIGQTAAEWVKVWFAPQIEIDRLAVECRGWQCVEEARRGDKAIIFLLPHLGSFQFAMRYIAERLPLTALYRPPPVRWLKPLMVEGSKRAKLSLAPTNLKGVQVLVQALKRGEAIALPPDQAPRSRGGVWVKFFGRLAYTSTLPRKLQRSTNALIIAAFAERLPSGAGFRLHLRPVSTEGFDETALNQLVEQMVRRCPSQFLWSYNRYRIPNRARTMGEEAKP